MQVVGNVFGITNGYNICCLFNETNGFSAYPVFELGFPNIGNNGYTGTAPPLPFNNPGTNFSGYFSEQFTNFAFLITNAPAVPTNQITTNMGIALFPSGLASYPAPLVRGYPIKFLDPNNPLKYWPDDGRYILTTSAGTSSNLALAVYTSGGILIPDGIQISNGWTVVLAGQAGYQQLQLSNKHTHLLHGNLVYTNNLPGLVWDSGVADQNIPKSLLYGDTAPSWWGTNRWPAYDPTNSPYITQIPAQLRLNGVSGGGGESPASNRRLRIKLRRQ
jgi:hypothetical protein